MLIIIDFVQYVNMEQNLMRRQKNLIRLSLVCLRMMEKC